MKSTYSGGMDLIRIVFILTNDIISNILCYLHSIAKYESNCITFFYNCICLYNNLNAEYYNFIN